MSLEDYRALRRKAGRMGIDISDHPKMEELRARVKAAGGKASKKGKGKGNGASGGNGSRGRRSLFGGVASFASLAAPDIGETGIPVVDGLSLDTTEPTLASTINYPGDETTAMANAIARANGLDPNTPEGEAFLLERFRAILDGAPLTWQERANMVFRAGQPDFRSNVESAARDYIYRRGEPVPLPNDGPPITIGDDMQPPFIEDAPPPGDIGFPPSDDSDVYVAGGGGEMVPYQSGGTLVNTVLRMLAGASPAIIQTLMQALGGSARAGQTPATLHPGQCVVLMRDILPKKILQPLQQYAAGFQAPMNLSGEQEAIFYAIAMSHSPHFQGVMGDCGGLVSSTCCHG